MPRASILVIGSGMAGLTAAIEAAEMGYGVFIVEKEPYLGGRVAQINKYFPKLCPPYCGLEINFRRIKTNPRIKFRTLATVEKVSGRPGDFDATIRCSPRYVQLDRCTACNDCVEVCPAKRFNDFNLGMDTTKAIFLPHVMALPMKYTIDDKACLGAECAECVQVCKYDAIDLNMKPRTINLKAGSIVLATGWKPYDATKVDNLGFGKHRNVITNVMMERLASVAGPTRGAIIRPSDGKEVRSVAFVQCAGSRDDNHLPYCSAICCLTSIKQATYVRELYPDSKVYIFYIDIRAIGRFEDLYTQALGDEKVGFIKGKVTKIEEDADTKDLTVVAEHILLGERIGLKVDLVVLATGMVSAASGLKMPGIDITRDPYGFILPDPESGVSVAGLATRPMDVATSARSGAGAALKAIQNLRRE